MIAHLAPEGPFARVLSKVERGRSPRAELRPAPGRLRVSLMPVLRPVREVLSLDWDRRRRVTPARSESQEAWPGVEPVGCEPSGESRGRAPKGVRVPLDARPHPRQQAATLVGLMRQLVGCAFWRSASLALWEDL